MGPDTTAPDSAHASQLIRGAEWDDLGKFSKLYLAPMTFDPGMVRAKSNKVLEKQDSMGSQLCGTLN